MRKQVEKAYRAEREHMLRYAERHVNREEAEDILQDVFFNALRSLDSMDADPQRGRVAFHRAQESDHGLVSQPGAAQGDQRIPIGKTPRRGGGRERALAARIPLACGA